MKFQWGMPPEPPCRLAEPRRLVTHYGRLHALTIVLGLVLVGPCLYLCWAWLWPGTKVLGIFDQPPGVFIGSLVAIVVVHEFIHLLALPGSGRGAQSYMGFEPKAHLPYVAYLGELGRRRLIAIALMPALVLTVAPLLLAGVVTVEHRYMLSACSVLNGIAASGDFCIVFLLLWKVPRGALIQGEFYGRRMA